MADRSIADLTAASSITSSDLFVVQQGLEAKSVSGAVFMQYIEGHGGIASISLGADYKLTIVFSDGTSWTSSVSIQGPQGATGSGASVTTTEYAADSQGTTPPESGWQSSIPTVGGGNFLWTRFTWNNGTYSYITSKYGNNGLGSGDMEKSEYDSDETVLTAGGIKDYVIAQVPTSAERDAWTAKQNAINSTTDLTVRTLTGGLTYTTAEPTSANTDGLKIVVLASEPTTKYDGWLYIITE